MYSSQTRLPDESPQQNENVYLNQEQSIDFGGLSQTQRTLTPLSERKQRRYRESLDRINVYRSPALSSDSEEEPVDDAFASLECLIDDDKEESSTNVEPAQETNEQQQEDTATDIQGSISATPLPEASAPSSNDFPIHSANEAELEQNNESTGTFADPNTFPDSGSALEREIRRTRALQNNVHKPSQSSLFSDANKLLEKSRRAAVKQSRATFFRDDLAHDAKRPKKGSAPVAVANTKSIVGSRPKHWGTFNAIPRSFGNRRTLFRMRKPQIATELAKTTMSHSSLQPACKTPPSEVDQAKASHLSDAAESSSANTPTTGPMTFAPTFLSKRSFVASTEPVDNTEPFSTILCSPSRSNVQSPPSRKRKAGVLVKRLQTLRDAVKGDSIRFQSGQYPFKGSFDTNDPRYRAKTYIDVTILQDSVSWEKEHQRLTVLGYIHAHKPTASDTSNLVGSKSLVWLCFSYTTAREQNLGLGSQLRIYNAVVLPINEGVAADGVSAVRWLVVCTQLCERYPSILPALPSSSELAVLVGQSSQKQADVVSEK